MPEHSVFTLASPLNTLWWEFGLFPRFLCDHLAYPVSTASRSMNVSNEDEPVAFEGHTRPIFAVAYSPNGKQIATGSDDGLITIWDSKKGNILLQLQGHTKSVEAVSFSRNGSRLVSGSGDHTLCIWDTATGETVGDKWEAHSDTRREGGPATNLGCTTKDEDFRDYPPPVGVRSVTFSPDGTCLATACIDGGTRIFNIRTGALVVGPLAGHTGSVAVVAYSPDGTKLASGSFDDTIIIWDARTGILLLGPLEGHMHTVSHVEYSPDGKTLLSSSDDGTIRLWDPATGDLVAGPLRRHYGGWVVATYSPDGDCFVSAGKDGSIRLWDATTWDVILPLMTEVDQLDYEITGPFRGHTSPVRGVAYFPDGMRVASVSEDKSIRIWDVQTGVLVKELAESGHVLSLSISCDRKRLVSGAFRSITVWDCITWQVALHVPERHSGWVYSVAFSPDTSLIATAGDRGDVFIWNSHTGEHVRTMSGHDPTMEVWTVTFSPDGQRIASGSQDHTIRIWDVHNAEAIAGPLEGHSDAIKCVAFSPDGKTIASVSVDATLRVWDIELGNLRLAPIQHNSTIRAVSYSPDGKTICTACDDSTISLWHATTGELILDPLRGHRKVVSSIVFSPDGKRILTGSWDQTLKLWDSSTGEMIKFSESILTEQDGNLNALLDLPALPLPSRTPRAGLADGITDQLGFPETSRPVPTAEQSPIRGPLAGLWSRLRTLPHRNSVNIRLPVTPIYPTPALLRILAAGPPEGLEDRLRAAAIPITFDDEEYNMPTPATLASPLNTLWCAFGPSPRFVCDHLAYLVSTASRPMNVPNEDEPVAFEGYTRPIFAVAYSPNGKQIATGSVDGLITIWDSKKGNILLQLQGHTKIVYAVSFSRNGSRLVSGSKDHTLCIWDTATGETVGDKWEAHSDAVWGVTYSPDDEMIASGGGDGLLRVWDAQRKMKIIKITDHPGIVRSVTFSPNGTCSSVPSSDGVVKGAACELHAIWAPACQMTSQFAYGTFRELQTGVLVKELGESGQILSLSISSDGKRLVSGAFRSITVWDCITWQVTLHVPERHSGWAYSVAFSPDASLVAIAGDCGEVFIWNSHTGEHVRKMSGHDPSMKIWTVTFSPDGQRIASGSQDHTIRIWDVHNAEAIAGPLEGHRGAVKCVAFSPDGKTIASVSADATLRVWDIELGSLSLAPIQHNSIIRTVSYSPDGKTICTACEDSTISLWHATTGELILGPLRGHRKHVSSIAFSPDGKRILTGSGDQTLKLWDSSTGEMIKFSESILTEQDVSTRQDSRIPQIVSDYWHIEGQVEYSVGSACCARSQSDTPSRWYNGPIGFPNNVQARSYRRAAPDTRVIGRTLVPPANLPTSKLG
ncbi:hypothetical protein BU15DRAFT_83124 [Melanogaster broomeanus]|nr:hypothetical protein BU15DRAFT_83124 [Melanogaster broomeanus]